jgi:ADP-ribosylglycohydrolase
MIMREWPILEATVSMNFAVYICLLTTDSYKEAVLKAVNLGNDTDTTGAVTGGLAGLLYGFENIPKNWVEQIARKDDIENLSKRLMQKLATK